MEIEEREAEVKKKANQVTIGKVQKKEKTNLQKLREDLGISDSRTVFTSIIKDVILPALKTLISEMVNNGISIWLYGKKGDDRSAKNRSRVSYRSYYEDRYDDRPSASPRGNYQLDDILFDEYADADAVLNSMDEIISKYRMASIGDFYDLCGIQGDYTDEKYGWYDLDMRDVKIVRTRDGRYYIRMPRPVALK